MFNDYQRVVALSTMEKAVKTASSELREHIRRELNNQRMNGTYEPQCVEMDGAEVGKVILTNPKPVYEVTDTAAHKAWCRANNWTSVQKGIAWHMVPPDLQEDILHVLSERAPDAVLCDEVVDTEYRKQVVVMGDGTCIYKPSGEVIPGLLAHEQVGDVRVTVADAQAVMAALSATNAAYLLNGGDAE